MTGEQIKDYIINELDSEPRHNCEALANAINNDPKVGPVTQFAGNNLNEVLKEFNESYDSFTSKKVKLS